MDERRGEQPAPDRGAHPPIASAGARLSPVQEAWSSYVTHRLRCDACRDIDQGTCGESERLHRAWIDVSHGALDRIAREAN
ncbi:hypothetical protein F7R91_14860 [Streptomyces luteolifulvus]|uniref:Uncharacterized protein n=1 Tax=Streptomyces luteolifulvus TaxID=2615112 RepID=A0A6H9UZL3_9ACTN|nr:hypothetical protein [Streptomyces luteolifulvus]KAB1146854.1 hypothetical protein F7R91_14860 [Streptomyces luteolifulvus]